MHDMREGLCPLCEHSEVIKASGEVVGRDGSPRPLSVSHEFSWAGVKHEGVLDTYVCRRCGFTQWFARDPEQIPIGDGHRTQLVRGTKSDGGPYR